jgi:hypothetical protein
MNNTTPATSASRIAVAAGEAASIEAAAGAAIQCVAGRLWLTQEGDARDYVVPAGTTFCTDRAGRVVVSALDTAALVVVRKSAPAHCARGTVTIDSIERFARSAREAQAAYVAETFVRFGRWLARLFRRDTIRPATSLRAACPERSRSSFDSAGATLRTNGGWTAKSKGPRRTDGFRGYVRSL